MELEPGFRFHPTDEEVLSHYIRNKIRNPKFSCSAMDEFDVYSVDAPALPSRAKLASTGSFWFFVRRIGTGSGARRVSPGGYWKSSGKDRKIFKGNDLIGTKKTLVFYFGRSPKGVKSDWIMHEYRSSATSKDNEWVACCVFVKRSDAQTALVGDSNAEIDPAAVTQLPPPPQPLVAVDNLLSELAASVHVEAAAAAAELDLQLETEEGPAILAPGRRQERQLPLVAAEGTAIFGLNLPVISDEWVVCTVARKHCDVNRAPGLDVLEPTTETLVQSPPLLMAGEAVPPKHRAMGAQSSVAVKNTASFEQYTGYGLAVPDMDLTIMEELLRIGFNGKEFHVAHEGGSGSLEEEMNPGDDFFNEVENLEYLDWSFFGKPSPPSGRKG